MGSYDITITIIISCYNQSQTLNINILIADLFRRYKIEKITNKDSVTFQKDLPLLKGILQ